MSDNYPPGMENDPNAPWNQDPEVPQKVLGEEIEEDDWDEEDPEQEELEEIL